MARPAATLLILLTAAACTHGRAPVAGTAGAVGRSVGVNVVPVGFPSARTTGVPVGTLLSSSGDIVVRKAGTVLDRLDIVGCVTVRADHVVIRRSRIRCAGVPGIWPVRVYAGVRDVLVEDTEIDGAGVATVAVQGDNYTLRRVNIHDAIDGPRLGSGTVVEDSYIHDLTHLPGTHNDTLQTIGGHHIRVSHNTLLAYNAVTDDPNNAAIQTGRLHSPLSDMLVEGNYMDGGSYTVRGGSGPRDRALISRYVFRHNTFGHDCGFGPVNGIDAPVTWDPTNHWIDSPLPLTSDSKINRTGCHKSGSRLARRGR